MRPHGTSAPIAGGTDEVYLQDLSRRLELAPTEPARAAPRPQTGEEVLAAETGTTEIHVAARRRDPVGRLVVVGGPDHGQVFELAAETTSVGRDLGNTIVLADPTASRRHAEIRRREGTYELADLDSGNGTRRNGRRLRHRALLFDGDEIEIGQTIVSFAWSRTPPVARAASHQRPASRIARTFALLAGIGLVLLATATIVVS
jgi:pSer/pThr/pTyr-binding forkhead associated (FHA) protein